MVRLALSFLNSFKARLDDAPITQFRSAKVQGLLAYLALEAERPHARESLATLFWPDETQSAASHNLRQSLYQLRRVLGDTRGEGPPFLLVDRHSLQINRDSAYDLDVDRFLGALAQADLETACALYTGELLPGFTCDSVDFEEWLRRRRDHLHQRALTALHTLTERHLLQGAQAVEAAQETARRQLALAPWREEAHQQLMRALALAGDRSAALAQFEHCVNALADELGVPPSETTLALHEAIRDGRLVPEPPTVAAPATIACNLPPPLEPFVGRDRELATLTRLLTDGPARLVTILGPGGAGKTRLSIEAGRAFCGGPTPSGEAGFPDGVFFVSLAALSDPEDIPAAIAAALGHRFPAQGDPRAGLLDYLGRQRLLLILDNFEHLVVAADRVQEILLAAPRVRLLITSRHRLDLQGETVMALDGLDLPADADQALSSGAVQLFLQSARRNRLGFTLTPADQEPVLRICRQVHGLPLGILLAAAWVDTLSPAEIAAEIERDVDFLEAAWQDAPARHRSIRATFNHSWNLLSPLEQAVFARLSVFRGGFTRAAAQAVARAPLRLLARLVSKSLLQYAAHQGRYAVHELLRQLGTEKLSALGDEAAVREAHSDYYLLEVSRRREDLRGRDQIDALETLNRDVQNVQVAWRLAAERQDLARLAATADALYEYFRLSGRADEGIAAFDASLRALAGADTAPGGRLEDLRVRLQIRRYALEEGPPSFSTADAGALLDHCRAQEDRAEEALAWVPLARIAYADGEYDEVVRIHERRLRLYRQLRDACYVGRTHGNLAFALLHTRRVEEGAAAARRCIELMRAVGDRLAAANAFHLLGGHELVGTGNYDAAASYLRQGAETATALGARAYGASIRGRLALIALTRGELAEARRLAQEALDQATAGGDREGIVAAASDAGLVDAVAGRYGEAEARLRGHLENTNNRSIQLRLRLGMAIVNWARGEWDETARQALYRWPDLPAGRLLAAVVWYLPVMAAILAAGGRGARAVELLALGRAHAACPRGWWAAWPLLAALEAELAAALGSEAHAAAVDRGRGLDLLGVAEALPATLEG